MTARSSGFTLIELIVVVAIIGTLAAVGVTAYSGYTDSAKKQSAKTNHATIAKYIAAETTKCELEEDTVMDGNLDCDDLRVVNAVSTATGNALADFSNPFETDQEAIVTGPAQDCGEDTEGMTFVDNSDTCKYKQLSPSFHCSLQILFDLDVFETILFCLHNFEK